MWVMHEKYQDAASGARVKLQGILRNRIWDQWAHQLEQLSS